ncbi:MAG: hypothetical protein PVF33_11030 [Candidatus Latescibacterota bacterium]|jgi:hypothetical protein
MKWAYPVAASLSLLLIGGLILAPTVATAPAVAGEGQVDIKTLKEQLDTQQREMREFKGRIEALADDREDADNSERSEAIKDLHEAMKTYILRLEKKLGPAHHIIHHLEPPEDYEESDEAFEDPAYNSGRMGNEIETGGTDEDPELYRLARFQQIYITCQHVETEAINGTDWAFKQYYNMVVQFAGLMNTEIGATRTQIESATSKANMSN